MVCRVGKKHPSIQKHLLVLFLQLVHGHFSGRLAEDALEKNHLTYKDITQTITYAQKKGLKLARVKIANGMVKF